MNAIRYGDLTDHPVALEELLPRSLDLRLLARSAATVEPALAASDEFITPPVQRLLRDPGAACNLHRDSNCAVTGTLRCSGLFSDVHVGAGSGGVLGCVMGLGLKVV